jgi:REP element-mobilizing transposase RayT
VGTVPRWGQSLGRDSPSAGTVPHGCVASVAAFILIATSRCLRWALALYAPVSRQPRSVLEGAYFHVTSRATGGMALFEDDVDRTEFIELLVRTACDSKWKCHAYCLMTTHYHLLLETSQRSLSKGMHRLNGIYAQRFNRRHRRRGHLFEERFSAHVIDREEHFEAACRYVFENPVRAGLCDHADLWPWSGGLGQVERLVKGRGRAPFALGTVPP